MSVYKLKPAFQSCLRPFVKFLAKCHITANQVTLLAVFLSVATAIFLFWHGPSIWWSLLPFLLLLRMALNAIDGMLAREFNMQSQLGFVLNELGDLVSDAAIYLCLLTIPGFNALGVFIFILLAWLTEFVALLGQTLLQQRSNHGPFGKSDRAVLLGFLGVLVAFDVDFSTAGDWIILIACIALLLTIYHRIKVVI